MAKKTKIKLPLSKCKFGYTTSELNNILGDKYNDFCKYMVGQTGMICQGERCKESHGMITYQCDLETFLEGRPTLD